MEEENKDIIEICISYKDKENAELTNTLLLSAKMLNGVHASTTNEDGECEMVFNFTNEEDATDFVEQANIHICSFYPLIFDSTENQVQNRKFQNGVYHHASFDDEDSSVRFANMLRAAFSTYLTEDMYDICLVNVEEDSDFPYMVLYGFPIESVLIAPSNLDEAEMSEEEYEDLFKKIDSLASDKKDKKKILN